MRLTIASFIALCAITSSARAVTIDVNQAFINFELANSGPTAAVNGNFQYGSGNSPTALVQYPSAEHTDNLGGFNGAIQGYNQANGTLTPFLVVNTDTVNAQTICCGITLQPSEIGLHPDNGGAREYSIISWTAPSNGTYIDTAIYSNRGGNAGTAVYLVDPSGTQTSTTGVAPTLTSSGSILAGQSIYFAVSTGTSFGANSTGLYATIQFTPVPEPASLLLAGLGTVGLGMVIRRRRSA